MKESLHGYMKEIKSNFKLLFKPLGGVGTGYYFRIFKNVKRFLRLVTNHIKESNAKGI